MNSSRIFKLMNNFLREVGSLLCPLLQDKKDNHLGQGSLTLEGKHSFLTTGFGKLQE